MRILCQTQAHFSAEEALAMHVMRVKHEEQLLFLLFVSFSYTRDKQTNIGLTELMSVRRLYISHDIIWQWK